MPRPARHSGRHRTEKPAPRPFGALIGVLMVGIVAAIAVAGCSSDAAASSTNDPRNEWVQIGEPGGNEVFKYCDGPNLVYVADGYEAVGITVVETSAACR